jgi:hypothetical protein
VQPDWTNFRPFGRFVLLGKFNESYTRGNKFGHFFPQKNLRHKFCKYGLWAAFWATLGGRWAIFFTKTSGHPAAATEEVPCSAYQVVRAPARARSLLLGRIRGRLECGVAHDWLVFPHTDRLNGKLHRPVFFRPKCQTHPSEKSAKNAQTVLFDTKDQYLHAYMWSNFSGETTAT